PGPLPGRERERSASLFLRQREPGAERLGDAPGLGGTALRREGRRRVKDLRDGADALVAQVMSHRRQERERRRAVLVDAEMREGEWTEEPAPDRSLMIGAVAPVGAAGIRALISRIARREAPQSERRVEVAGARVDHAPLAVGVERAFGERYR